MKIEELTSLDIRSMNSCLNSLYIDYWNRAKDVVEADLVGSTSVIQLRDQSGMSMSYDTGRLFIRNGIDHLKFLMDNRGIVCDAIGVESSEIYQKRRNLNSISKYLGLLESRYDIGDVSATPQLFISRVDGNIVGLDESSSWADYIMTSDWIDTLGEYIRTVASSTQEVVDGNFRIRFVGNWVDGQMDDHVLDYHSVIQDYVESDFIDKWTEDDDFTESYDKLISVDSLNYCFYEMFKPLGSTERFMKVRLFTDGTVDVSGVVSLSDCELVEWEYGSMEYLRYLNTGNRKYRLRLDVPWNDGRSKLYWKPDSPENLIELSGTTSSTREVLELQDKLDRLQSAVRAKADSGYLTSEDVQKSIDVWTVAMKAFQEYLVLDDIDPSTTIFTVGDDKVSARELADKWNEVRTKLTNYQNLVQSGELVPTDVLDELKEAWSSAVARVEGMYTQAVSSGEYQDVDVITGDGEIGELSETYIEVYENGASSEDDPIYAGAASGYEDQEEIESATYDDSTKSYTTSDGNTIVVVDARYRYYKEYETERFLRWFGTDHVPQIDPDNVYRKTICSSPVLSNDVQSDGFDEDSITEDIDLSRAQIDETTSQSLLSLTPKATIDIVAGDDGCQYLEFVVTGHRQTNIISFNVVGRIGEDIQELSHYANTIEQCRKLYVSASIFVLYAKWMKDVFPKKVKEWESSSDGDEFLPSYVQRIHDVLENRIFGTARTLATDLIRIRQIDVDSITRQVQGDFYGREIEEDDPEILFNVMFNYMPDVQTTATIDDTKEFLSSTYVESLGNELASVEPTKFQIDFTDITVDELRARIQTFNNLIVRLPVSSKVNARTSQNIFLDWKEFVSKSLKHLVDGGMLYMKPQIDAGKIVENAYVEETGTGTDGVSHTYHEYYTENIVVKTGEGDDATYSIDAEKESSSKFIDYSYCVDSDNKVIHDRWDYWSEDDFTFSSGDDDDVEDSGNVDEDIEGE